MKRLALIAAMFIMVVFCCQELNWLSLKGSQFSECSKSSKEVCRILGLPKSTSVEEVFSIVEKRKLGLADNASRLDLILGSQASDPPKYGSQCFADLPSPLHCLNHILRMETFYMGGEYVAGRKQALTVLRLPDVTPDQVIAARLRIVDDALALGCDPRFGSSEGPCKGYFIWDSLYDD